jgi:hypothetical protein
MTSNCIYLNPRKQHAYCGMLLCMALRLFLVGGLGTRIDFEECSGLNFQELNCICKVRKPGRGIPISSFVSGQEKNYWAQCPPLGNFTVFSVTALHKDISDVEKLLDEPTPISLDSGHIVCQIGILLDFSAKDG